MRLLALASFSLLLTSSLVAQDTVRLAEIRVVGSTAALPTIPGSVEVLNERTLRLWHAQTMNEPLRRVSGLVLRDEEGLGLRPNIGIRGLNPTRSSKVLLLEDGLPVTFAPYGGNETYYHPSLDRFSRIEVLKGSGQILFGPQTVGGVINYITPAIPRRPSGSLALESGTGGALSATASGGASFGRFGLLGSYDHKLAEGSRENISSTIQDGMIKGTMMLGSRQLLTARANAFRERSNVAYSGLTEAEWAANPYGNVFINDSMFVDRGAASLTHQLELSGRASLTTSVYSNTVKRHWWRQASNSSERPIDAADPACGGMQNLNTTCGNIGNLRLYRLVGFEPRLHASYDLFGLIGVVDAGARVHLERQQRRGLTGDTPDARTATVLREDNIRSLTALSAFVQNRFIAGRWAFTPGARLERISYRRTNVLADVSGRNEITQLVPGMGVTWEAANGVTLFGGLHRGFSPPRPEDVIDNATGNPVELDAELSWNSEIGIRAQVGSAFSFQSTLFRMDFENQIVAASAAGGTGATLTNAGRTLQQGMELSGRLDVTRSVHLEAAFTWLPTARFEGDRFVYVGTGGGDVAGKVYPSQNAGATRTQTSVTGKRLPYAPGSTLTVGIGFAHRALDTRLEAVFIGRQFGDALNTTTLVADGQQGVIPAYTIVNAAATYTLPRLGTGFFFSAQNLLDRLYISDRTRGLLPGPGRRVQLGLKQDF